MSILEPLDFDHPSSIERFIIELMTQTPTLSQLLKHVIDNRLLDIHTALIGHIEKYDTSTQLADIQPVLRSTTKNAAGEVNNQALPLLVDVPIIFPRSGGFFLSLPIQQGDFVQVIINETSIDEFLTESANTIDSAGRFTLQGAVGIPGVFPQSQALHGVHKVNLVMGKDRGVQIHIDGDKIYLGSDQANEALAIASKVKQELDRIILAFNAHSHACTVGTVSPPASIASSDDIATKRVVAE